MTLQSDIGQQNRHRNLTLEGKKQSYSFQWTYKQKVNSTHSSISVLNMVYLVSFKNFMEYLALLP